MATTRKLVARTVWTLESPLVEGPVALRANGITKAKAKVLTFVPKEEGQSITWNRVAGQYVLNVTVNGNLTMVATLTPGAHKDVFSNV